MAFNKPAPRWYRITKKIWSNTENLVLAILLIYGHGEGSFQLIIFKISSSFLKENLDTLLSNGEEYAPAGTVQTLANVTNTPVETKTKTIHPESGN